MIRAVFAIPGDIDSPTGGYAYDRHVLSLLGPYGVAVEHLTLAGRYPFPDATALDDARVRFASYGDDVVTMIDGLAFGALPGHVIDAISGPIVALVHHPLAYETGLSDEQSKSLHATEQSALAKADRIIATGEVSAELLRAHYDVAPDRITLAQPGTEDHARATGTGQPVQLLSVGAISPRKGYVHLVEALSKLRALDWRLDIVGSLSHDRAEAARLAEAVNSAGLQERISLMGGIDDVGLDAAFDRSDVFVMSSLFEGFGMVLTEAIARGLPVVTTRVGAADTIVPDAAALKVVPGNTAALSGALRQVIIESDTRGKMADAAWGAAGNLPRWHDTAAIIAGVIKDLKR